jgi:GAF domain-containing protein
MGHRTHRLRRTRTRRQHRRASERRRAISETHSPTDTNEAFAQLGRIVLGEQPLETILEQVVHIAKKVLPTPVEASITLVADDQPFTVAFTDQSAVELDERQYETERGPCLDAAASGQLISIPDTSAETPWPRFTQTAAQRGIGSTLSVPLPVQRQVTGALNFYATEVAAFSEANIDLAQTFAAHAGVAAANAHLYESTAALAEQMKQAMATRAVIEQAKGIIMRDRNCPPDEAFDALVRLSQETHLKLRDVAQRLVDHVSTGGSASSLRVT